MFVIEQDPLPVRVALWLKGQGENWQRAWTILFPSVRHAQPIEPHGNVVLLQKVRPEQVVAFMDSHLATTGQRLSHAEVAEHFDVHRTTVTRALQKIA